MNYWSFWSFLRALWIDHKISFCFMMFCIFVLVLKIVVLTREIF